MYKFVLNCLLVCAVVVVIGIGWKWSSESNKAGQNELTELEQFEQAKLDRKILLRGISSTELLRGFKVWKSSITTWKKRISSGEWSRMVEDGSYVDLIDENAPPMPLEDYPNWEIDRINGFIDIARDELKKRGEY